MAAALFPDALSDLVESSCQFALADLNGDGRGAERMAASRRSPVAAVSNAVSFTRRWPERESIDGPSE
jgi:hypothetical protein